MQQVTGDRTVVYLHLQYIVPVLEKSAIEMRYIPGCYCYYAYYTTALLKTKASQNTGDDLVQQSVELSWNKRQVSCPVPAGWVLAILHKDVT